MIHSHDASSESSSASAQFTTGNIYGQDVGHADECVMFRDPPTGGLSAGTIHITGTAAPITLTPSGSPTTYDAGSVPTQPFTPGAALTVTADGAAFPAFHADVIAPVALSGVTTPATISRASGDTLTWTPGSGRIWIILPVVGPDEYALMCKVADTGSYQLPPAALALYPATVHEVAVLVARVGENDVLVGPREVDVAAMDMIEPSNTTMLVP